MGQYRKGCFTQLLYRLKSSRSHVSHKAWLDPVNISLMLTAPVFNRLHHRRRRGPHPTSAALKTMSDSSHLPEQPALTNVRIHVYNSEGLATLSEDKIVNLLGEILFESDEAQDLRGRITIWVKLTPTSESETNADFFSYPDGKDPDDVVLSYSRTVVWFPHKARGWLGALVDLQVSSCCLS